MKIQKKKNNIIMLNKERTLILKTENISVYKVQLEYVMQNEWEAISYMLSSWHYPFCYDQRYISGGNPLNLNLNTMKFNLRYKESYLLIAYLGNIAVGFAELYFNVTPIKFINDAKELYSHLGKICFSAMTMVSPEYPRQGISTCIEKAKYLLCSSLNTPFIMTLIYICPIPNLISLNRAHKLGATFTGRVYESSLIFNSKHIKHHYAEIISGINQQQKVLIDSFGNLMCEDQSS